MNNSLVIFIFLGVIVLLSSISLNLSKENSRLGEELNLVTNPPPFVLRANLPAEEIILSYQDQTNLAARAKQFSDSFIKEHGHKPKVTLLLCASAKHSNHLFRQIRDCLLGGWDIEFHADQTFTVTPPSLIEIYTGDIGSPPPQYDFWIKTLQSCALETYGGPWGQKLEDGKVIIYINDPTYVNAY